MFCPVVDMHLYSAGPDPESPFLLVLYCSTLACISSRSDAEGYEDEKQLLVSTSVISSWTCTRSLPFTSMAFLPEIVYKVYVVPAAEMVELWILADVSVAYK
jgi:hypothetical protein